MAVSWLEIAGTHLGTWAWGTHDPTGWVSIGNPPSGAAGGYGWFDLAALLAAPLRAAAVRAGSVLVGGVGRAADRRAPTCAEVVQRPVPARGDVGVVLVVGQRAEERQRLVVQPAVAGQRVAAGAGRACRRGR